MDHTHEENDNDIIIRQIRIRNSLKRKGQDDICERPIKLIHNEIKSVNTDTLNKTDMFIYIVQHCVLYKPSICNIKYIIKSE